MKYAYFVLFPFFLLTSMLTLACKKEVLPQNPSVSSSQGSGQVLRNGQILSLNASTLVNPKYPGRFSIALSHFNEVGYLRGSLTFRRIPYQKGIYEPLEYLFSLDPAIDSLFTANYGSNISHGDVAGDIYVLIDTSSNFVSIDSLNLVTKEVFGRFSLLMRKDTSFGELDKSVPYILEFSEGSYAVTVTR